MKEKTKQALIQTLVGALVFFISAYAFIKMYFSGSFLVVYDSAGNWHIVPQLTRYFLYAVLAVVASVAAYAAYWGGRYLLRKVQKNLL